MNLKYLFVSVGLLFNHMSLHWLPWAALKLLRETQVVKGIWICYTVDCRFMLCALDVDRNWLGINLL